jgi:hypothetical protein
MKFIRKNGRIIPIAEKRKDSAKAAGAVAAGGAVALATAKATSGMMHDSAKAENAARTAAKSYTASKMKFKQLGPLFEHAKPPMDEAKAAMRFAVQSKGLEKKAFKVRNLGTAIAAALIGVGVNKALDHTKLKDEPGKKAAVSTGAAVVATFAVMSPYYRGVGNTVAHALKLAAKRVVRGR